MPRRAALYARFSTELQNASSVDDQIVLCSDFAERDGYEIVAEYTDRARTGTTTHGRPGLQRLLHDAREGRFETVIVEALDRLSRDQEDLAGIHKRLTFAGIEIIAVHDGRADALQVGIRGLVSTLFIADLKHKVRRGMSAVVRDGRHAGGRAYGYRPVPGQPGVLAIEPNEAEVVRRIFESYVAGLTPREIAGTLNTDGIPPPRGTWWNASTINGNRARGYGILQNPIYAGRIVWNRVRMVRDPETGKRVSRTNPESEWQHADAPELAIVSRKLWDQAQAVRGRRDRTPSERRKHDPRHRRILSGLLRCGKCGGGMTMHDRRGSAVRIRCSNARESGTCGNERRYRLDKIETTVVNGMLDRLRQPDSIASFLETQQEDRRNAAKARAKAERALAKVEAKIDRLSKALIDGRVSEEFFDREIAPLRAELAERKQAAEAAPPGNVVTLHPAALKAMEETLSALAQHLPTLDPREDRDMFEAFRSLIDKVVIHDASNGGVEAEVIGHLTALIGEDAGDSWGVSVVAEEGLEPPTHGL